MIRLQCGRQIRLYSLQSALRLYTWASMRCPPEYLRASFAGIDRILLCHDVVLPVDDSSSSSSSITAAAAPSISNSIPLGGFTTTGALGIAHRFDFTTMATRPMNISPLGFCRGRMNAGDKMPAIIYHDHRQMMMVLLQNPLLPSTGHEIVAGLVVNNFTQRQQQQRPLIPAVATAAVMFPSAAVVDIMQAGASPGASSRRSMRAKQVHPCPWPCRRSPSSRSPSPVRWRATVASVCAPPRQESSILPTSRAGGSCNEQIEVQVTVLYYVPPTAISTPC